MNELWQAIGELAAGLHEHRVEAIAESIGDVESAKDFEKARRSFGPNVDSERLVRLEVSWLATPEITPIEIAAALRGAAQAAKMVSSTGAVELVWTGPDTGLIPTRKTEQVILEVIDAAQERLFVVSYVFYKASSVVAALNAAIERGVDTRILLESSREYGGAVRGDGVKSMHAAVPGAKIYVWDSSAKNPDADSLSAVVHAKCAVADGRLAFVTSANLTPAALRHGPRSPVGTSRSSGDNEGHQGVGGVNLGCSKFRTMVMRECSVGASIVDVKLRRVITYPPESFSTNPIRIIYQSSRHVPPATRDSHLMRSMLRAWSNARSQGLASPEPSPERRSSEASFTHRP